MTLGIWALLLAAVRIAVAIHLRRSIYWQRYLTLLPSLLIPAMVDGLWILAVQTERSYHINAWLITQIVVIPLWFAIMVEVAKISCEPLSRQQQTHSVGVMLLAAGLGLEATIRRVNLSPVESFFVGRQFILLGMTFALAALWVWRWRYPSLENKEHFAFRACMTLRLMCMTAAAICCKGGLAWVILHWTPSSWATIDVVFWILTGVLVALQGWWMSKDHSSQVPQWLRPAPNGKRVLASVRRWFEVAEVE